jgi:hypothetical protein
VTALVVAAGALAVGAKTAAGVHPIVIAHMYLLLGGAVDGAWRSAEKMKPLVRGGERYQLYSLTGRRGQAAGTAVTIEQPGEYHHVALRPLPRSHEDVVGICAKWNAQPRLVKVQNPRQQVYQEAVRAILKKHGLPNARIGLVQALRVDLEGDGKEEVLLSATVPRSDYPYPVRRKGDYSVVALRRIVNGKVQTSILGEDYSLKDGSFEEGCSYEFDVLGVLDLNGDGIMEVLVRWEYYEGRGVEVHAVQGGKVRVVLSDGFGA